MWCVMIIPDQQIVSNATWFADLTRSTSVETSGAAPTCGSAAGSALTFAATSVATFAAASARRQQHKLCQYL